MVKPEPGRNFKYVATDSIDLRPVVAAALNAIESARVSPGRYVRWLGGACDQNTDAGDVNPYGCADAANILYTIGYFPTDIAERAAFISVLQQMQSPQTGLFEEATHHPFHVTAHCIAALQLFDAYPIYPLQALSFLDGPGTLEIFLDQLEWGSGPWGASHQGAGVFAARVVAGEGSLEWQDRYFNWLWDAQDPETGFWRKGYVAASSKGESISSTPLFDHLAGSFHYFFNHEYARRRIRYPAEMIDTCLRIRSENLWPYLGACIGFSDIDWVYCLTRALRQSGHRHGEVMDCLHGFAIQLSDFLLERVHTEDVPFDDLHTLFGTVCALAELQVALPGIYRTERPLHLVLDRRPFI